jgi:RNA polymerase sigma-70 factor (ECF subfamily)
MIAANRCRTAQSKKAQRPREGEFHPDTHSRPLPQSGELVEELDRALAQLRQEYKECFILFYQQELSILEIAEMLAVPEGTVKTWLHRARKELATHLADRGVAPYDRPAESH